MKQRRFWIVLLVLMLLGSGVLHFWEYRKIREFSDTFRTQAEIELKRTALLVIYQEVLQNVVREVDALKGHPANENDAAASRSPDFALPATLEP